MFIVAAAITLVYAGLHVGGSIAVNEALDNPAFCQLATGYNANTAGF